MNEQKSLLIYLGEALDRYRAARRRTTQEQASPKRSGWLRALLPTPGNVLFTLVVVAGLIWANSVGALPLRAPASANTSTGTIAYQGRLADADGNPLTDTYNMIFRLYDVASGGIFLWEELWTGSNSVQVSDGLFNVMLGSMEPIPQSVITGHDSLFLGITVGTDDEMTPRVQLGSVPFAVQALTVPDGSVTTEKIADEAVTQAKLGADVSLEPPDGSITTEKLADGAVTTLKIADGSVTDSKFASPITAQSWWAYCLTPNEPICGSSVVSDYSKTSVGNNQLLQWKLPFNNPFPHALVGYWGELQFADDAVVKGSVTIAIVPEGNVLRCSAMVPSGYFNTVNSRVYLTAYGY